MNLTDTQLAFLDTAMEYLKDADDFGYSTEARAAEIKAQIELELEERSYHHQQ